MFGTVTYQLEPLYNAGVVVDVAARQGRDKVTDVIALHADAALHHVRCVKNEHSRKLKGTLRVVATADPAVHQWAATYIAKKSGRAPL